MAQIGKNEAIPFEDIRNIVNEIVISARILSRLWAREQFSSDEQWEKQQTLIEKHEAIFWEGLEEDEPINPKVNKMIEDIEKTCVSVIADKNTLYGFLNFKIGKGS
jgi:hypothetical protein